LLLANTDLLEPTFRRSVIYIVEHNDGGTLGVVLNRPSETAVYNVLPQWAKLASKPKTMFIGGPVKRDAALCLAVMRIGSGPDEVPGLRHVAGRMAMVDLDADCSRRGGCSYLRRVLGLDDRSARGRDRARRLDCVVGVTF
jgi:putative transcriptional regulator